MDFRDKVRQKIKENPRVSGLIILVLGVLLFYVGFLKPLADIENGSPEVTFSYTGIIVGILVILIGIVFMIFGERFAHFVMMEDEERPKEQRYIIIGVTVVFCIILFILVEQYLESKGYTSR